MFTTEMFFNPFIVLWQQTIVLLPKIIVSVIVFFLGWFIARFVYKLIVRVSRKIRLDEVFRPVFAPVERAGYKVSIGRIIAFLVKWFIIIAALLIVLDLLQLYAAKLILIGLISYIPNVLIAILILLAGIALSDFVKRIILGSASVLNVKSAAFLANVAKVVLIIFAVLASLDLLIPNSMIVGTLFTGIVFMIALAGGLAFGLGGRDAAREAIEDLKRSMREK